LWFGFERDDFPWDFAVENQRQRVLVDQSIGSNFEDHRVMGGIPAQSVEKATVASLVIERRATIRRSTRTICCWSSISRWSCSLARDSRPMRVLCVV